MTKGHDMHTAATEHTAWVQQRGQASLSGNPVAVVGTAVEWDTLCGTAQATVAGVDDSRLILVHADGSYFALEPTRFHTLADVVAFLRPSTFMGDPDLAVA